MSLVLLFALLLVLSFVVLFYFLRPTGMEKAVARQLEEIESRPSNSSDRTSILKEDAVPSNTVAEYLAGRMPWSPMLSALIKQAGMEWRASSLFLLSIFAAFATGWLAWLMSSNAVITPVIGGAVGAAPYIYLYILRAFRRSRFDALLPEAVDLMSRGLRAGHSIAAVLEMVGNEIADPVGTEFRALHKEQSLGLPMREAMMNLVERMPLDDMRFLATAILLQKESGGNLAQILDKTSAVVRERARLRGQLKIYTAQGRITGWILCAAPFLMFALISVVNHNYEKTLFSNALGMKMIYGGLGLMVLGILAIRKIIDVKV
ncbi:MAG TPA: type II secretion system F family protein [Terriglobales bacterium]|jgi:tight adherence protein B|nr:type II secretion system F family protein [Terriglobales bacterium]